MTLTTQQQLLVEQRLTNDKKSTLVAYVLWFFTAGLGGHRFYMGKTGSAVAMLILTILGFLTLIIYIGGILLLIVAVWALVDAFLIPGWIEDSTRTARARISREIEGLRLAD
ncbi:TM2 domain-containing protein [Rhodobacter sp. NSM]|uniref:TM2 domain-containing protein n=1 Tax=Rhodobacter sp. NSM TaxID=3457501 RepID=UPI003FD17278